MTMKAHHIAALIDLVAEAAYRGEVTLEVQCDLNAALWGLAESLNLFAEVDSILQRAAIAEMEIAVQNSLKRG